MAAAPDGGSSTVRIRKLAASASPSGLRVGENGADLFAGQREPDGRQGPTYAPSRGARRKGDESEYDEEDMTAPCHGLPAPAKFKIYTRRFTPTKLSRYFFFSFSSREAIRDRHDLFSYK